MKRTRLLLIGVLASLSLAIQAQNYLPQKNSFSFGGGMMWGIGNTKGGFLDKTGNPVNADFIMSDFRYVNSGYYPSIGGNYEYYENWDSALNFLSLGVALMFGK